MKAKLLITISKETSINTLTDEIIFLPFRGEFFLKGWVFPAFFFALKILKMYLLGSRKREAGFIPAFFVFV
ncbi:MAG: hypothetical protein CH6_1499 [Candidatus Kapaibacterium sp.]|nr:MAG: hypothetical protein CH6_1499 [Candidatus Kapabacteria bacterium]ROL57753.1 MAG: hypothetical protein D9V84_03270 [Bacteroidetes/Chlorobi group bacterium Naka2016]